MPRTATATKNNPELRGNRKHYFALAAEMFRIIKCEKQQTFWHGGDPETFIALQLLHAAGRIEIDAETGLAIISRQESGNDNK